MSVTDLPTLNAALNLLATLFLLVGYVCIRQRRIAAHRVAMLGALGASAAFLTSYVIYHAQVGSRPFTGTGTIRYVYFAILVTHVLLAIDAGARFAGRSLRYEPATAAAEVPALEAPAEPAEPAE